MITFCIPSKNNKRYLEAAIPSIRKNSYYKDNKIVIFIDSDEDGTLVWCDSNYKKYDFDYFVNPNENNELYGIGKAYDFLIDKANTEMVCVFHADMMLAKHADKHMMDEWSEKTVVCATRIEPPLHPEGPEKIVRDFGMWPETDVEDGFREKEFDEFVQEVKQLHENDTGVTEGLFAPWLVSKKDFNAVGGHDYRFKSAREDSDLFNRFQLAGYKLKQTWQGFVYHLTARGGQFEHGVLTKDHSSKSKDWQVLMEASTKEFFRKWHTPVLHDEYMKPIIPPVYHTSIIAKYCNEQMIELLEPWCDKLYVDCDMNTILSYISKHQQYTVTDLSEKILYYNTEITGDVIVNLDCTKLTNENYNYLSMLSRIVEDSGQKDMTQRLDIFTIRINHKQDTKKDLIIC
tara:strand:- start:2059 stop:3264 length:1206 start_codon:yes stop_codon:yes gene_type:complete